MITGLGDTPLVFGIECPWCGHAHLVGSLGVRPITVEGDEIEMEPSLGGIAIDGDTDIGVVKCWECYRTFKFQFHVIPPEEDDGILVN